MILVPKNRHTEVQSILVNAGFRQQHSRIFQCLVTEGDTQYHCTIGLEDAGADTFEVNVSVMRRPSPKGKQAIRLEDVKVVSLDEVPQSLQDMVAGVEEQLEQLS